MTNRDVQIYLKIPKHPPTLLHRLENSFLECLIEFKIPPKGADLSRLDIFELSAIYQLKANVTVAGEELLIQFKAKNSGLHTGRVFANTREVCHPIAFKVARNGDVEALTELPRRSREFTELEGMVGGAVHSAVASAISSGLSSVRAVESEAGLLDAYQTQAPVVAPAFKRSSYQNPVVVQQNAYLRQQENVEQHISQQKRSPSYLSTVQAPYMSAQQPQQQYAQHRPFTGHSALPTTGCTFNQLHVAKEEGQAIPGLASGAAVNRSSIFQPSNSMLTPADFHSMRQGVKSTLASSLGLKWKVRCGICSKKVKSSRTIHLWDTDYCDSCTRRTFAMRSAIEHFMPPAIQECTVQVPINKRGNKFVTTQKMMPNVNLRGLEPADVRNAVSEFQKFDLEGDGWMDKAVLFPVMKACFTYSLPEKEIRTLLNSPTLKSMMEYMGLDKRDKVHKIEFLALLAFVARERQRITKEVIPHSQFTHNDLAMAYAFQHRFGPARPGSLLAPFQQPTQAQPLEQSPSFPQMVMRHSTSDTPLAQYPNMMGVAGDLHVASTATPASRGSAHFSPKSVSPTRSTGKSPDQLPQDWRHSASPRGEDESAPIEMPLTLPPSHAQPNSPVKQAGRQQSEDFKLSGDGRADGWMLY